ncbi:hypothetical protein NKH77_55390 [Streptomyces sp. M19]
MTGVSAAVPTRRGEATTSIGISVFDTEHIEDLGRTVGQLAARLGELLG